MRVLAFAPFSIDCSFAFQCEITPEGTIVIESSPVGKEDTSKVVLSVVQHTFDRLADCGRSGKGRELVASSARLYSKGLMELGSQPYN